MNERVQALRTAQESDEDIVWGWHHEHAKVTAEYEALRKHEPYRSYLTMEPSEGGWRLRLARAGVADALEDADRTRAEERKETHFAPPPGARTIDDETLYKSARVPCTRDESEAQDATASAVWGMTLGLAIGRHGAHWGQALADATVRVHIEDGWLEVFFYERYASVATSLDLDEVLACFREAWRSIGIEKGRERWQEEGGITVYEWNEGTDEVQGVWIPEREGVRNEKSDAWMAGHESARAARALIEAEADGIDSEPLSEDPVQRAGEVAAGAAHLLLRASETAAHEFLARYNAQEEGERVPTTMGPTGAYAAAVLPEPWRSQLLSALEATQRAAEEATAKKVGASADAAAMERFGAQEEGKAH